MSQFDEELRSLSVSSMVARNRAFFETLSVSQLSARNSRGPVVLKKRSQTDSVANKSSAGKDKSSPAKDRARTSSGLASSPLGASGDTPSESPSSSSPSATSSAKSKSSSSPGSSANSLSTTPGKTKSRSGSKSPRRKDKDDKEEKGESRKKSKDKDKDKEKSKDSGKDATKDKEEKKEEKKKGRDDEKRKTSKRKKTSEDASVPGAADPPTPSAKKSPRRSVSAKTLSTASSSPSGSPVPAPPKRKGSLTTVSVSPARRASKVPATSPPAPSLVVTSENVPVKTVGRQSPAPPKRSGFSKAPSVEPASPATPASNGGSGGGENGVEIDHEAGIVRLPPSLAPGAYQMDPEVEKKRQHVIRELMHTEADYAQQLKAIVQHFLIPMRENGVVSILEHSHIFSNLEILTLTTLDVSKALESRKRMSSVNGISGIGDIFLSKVDELIPVYSNYCSHQTNALETVEKLKMKEKKGFMQFCQEAKQQPGINGLELDALIIKPTQRICKYPLLFKELMRYTPEDHPDYKNLEKTQECLEKLVDVVNENSREANNLKHLRRVEGSLTGAGHIKLLMPGRHYIHEGRLTKISGQNIQERQFYLFSDMLLYAKPILGKSKYQFKGLIPLDALFYTDLDDSEAYENAFEVGRSDLSKKYILFTKERKTKYQWLQQLAAAKERLGQDSTGHADEIGFRMHTDISEIDTNHQLKLVDIQNRIEGTKDIIKADRKFVREGAAKGALGEDRYLWLFNDVLVIAKPKSAKRFVYKFQLPMDCIAVASLPDTPGVYENAIEFVRMDNQKKYQFELPSAAERDAWLGDLDAVSAMLLGGGQDKGLTPTLPERKATYSSLPKADVEVSDPVLTESDELGVPSRDSTPTPFYRQQSAPVGMEVKKDGLKKGERKRILKAMTSSSIIVNEDSDSDDEDLEEKKKLRKWDDDSTTSNCRECHVKFTTTNRRHHCRNCGQIFCNACSLKRRVLKNKGFTKKKRVCDRCFINPDRVTDVEASK